MAINFGHIRDCLAQFDFHKLFVNELGWSQPASRQEMSFAIKDQKFSRRSIAQLAGVVIFEITAEDRQIPDAKLRAAIHKEIAKQHHENILIFIDGQRTQSLWYWVKRQDSKSLVRDHLFAQGQPGDLFISKLVQMNFDLGEFDAEGNVSIVEVARKLRSALDVERVTKKFYGEFQEQHIAFLGLIKGVADERQRRWYASVLLNRLMFIYFLQKKGFLDAGNVNYLEDKLADSQERGRNQFFSSFLKLLFFEGFAKPEDILVECGRDGLEDIVIRRICELLHANAGEPTEIDVLPMDNKAQLIRDCGPAATRLLLSGCDRVVILWDERPAWPKSGEKLCWHNDRGDILANLRQARVRQHSVFLVCIEREFESWLLYDDRMISAVLSTDAHPIRIGAQRNPHRMPNPKGTMTSLFRQHRGWRYVDIQYARKFANGLIDLSRLRRCATFRRFAEKLTGRPL